MKVSGFTFIRNAVLYDYPVVEAIRSILPLCDEVVVAVGQSEDETLQLIQKIDPSKIKIIETVWDDNLREGGKVLAVETDKAFAAIRADSDWAFYIQGDEVIHEKYLPVIRQAMEKHLDDHRVDGLLFDYLHFYGSYDYVGYSYKWYPHEIRIVRNNSSIYAYGDAQGFRKGENKKLRVKAVDAFVYHYGWVKPPEAMQRKQEDFHKLWHNDEWVDKNIEHGERFVYEKHVSSLKRFEGTHPKVMLPRIAAQNWHFDYDLSFNRSSLKDRFKRMLKKATGFELIRKNYRLIN
jgi:glycosyltransferase involved in cell wall biosynthesis